MNDKDLRALAAKLLKHYVVEDEAVAKIVETKALDRGEPKVIPMITADERALLNMLGGPMAGVMEGRVVSLAAQGCGCGCGCGCGGGDGDDGDDGGEGAAASDASASADASADADAAAAAEASAAATGVAGDLGAEAAAAAEASAAATGVAGDLGAAADAAASAEASAAAAGATGAAAGDTAGTGLSAGEAAGWGGLGAGLGSQGAEGLAGLADGPDGPDSSMVGLTNDSLSMMSPAELSALMSAPQADRGISADTYSSLAAQNSALNDTLDAVGNGLDANAASQGSSGTLGGLDSLGIGSALGELFGISSAQAAQNSPSYGYMVSPYAAQGQLADPNAVALVNALTDRAAMPPSSTADKYGFNAFDPNAVADQNITSNAPFANYGLVGSQAFTSSPTVGAPGFGPSAQPDALDLNTQQVATTSVAPSPGLFAGTYTGAPAAPAAPAAPSQVAAAPSLAPEAPTTSLTVQGPAPTAMSSTSTQAQAPSYTGIDAIDSRIANALNNPGTTALNIAVGAVPGLGLANSLSGLLGGPTVGGALAGLASGAVGQASPSAGTDMGGGGGTNTYIPPTTTGSQNIDLATFDPTSLPTATSPADTTNAALRRYLGITGDPTKYGFGAQQQFYAAKGGMFDANQYFADGGMVQPLSPPTTPLVSAQPTMAFTDGAGAVGSIAQPPGLAPSDAYGSDAPHASPMAPSVAAAVPTMQPGLATLAVPNINASPVTSQVSQNPNVGYALGNSPLSNLIRS